MPAPAPAIAVPIWRGGGAAGVSLLGEARVAGFGGGGERCVGAVGDARQGGGEARRGGDVEAAEVLSPSVRVSSSEKGVWAPAVLAGGGGLEAGVEGTAGPSGQGAPSGPESRVKNWVEVCSGRGRVPGGEGAGDRVGAALGRGGEEAAFGAEEVQVEVGERGLGQVLGRRRRAGRSAGRGDGAGELDVGAEAVGGEEEAVAVAGWGSPR